ncbi:MAG: formimidoylglutamase [Bacteroidales bacterium]|nr:formimidoylglutamase [Bacteroidales bacterium]
MELEIYFTPVKAPVFESKTEQKRLGEIVDFYNETGSFPDLENVKIALFGVDEDRKALENTGCADGPDHIRKHLYRLFPHWNQITMVDLGNLKRGHNVEDTYFALKEVVAYLTQNGVVPVLLGGSQDLTYASYLAYENTGRVINIASIDPIFDLGHEADELNSRSYVSRIILHQPNFLFNYTNIGYQSYFVNQDALLLMRNLYFDINRLGNVRADVEETEPMVRNADILSVDISAVRAADAPGSFYAGPNGLSGEEACQICRYAGMSDQLSCVGFYEYNPRFDIRQQTAQLVAQMVWYFLDGFANRKQDVPDASKKDFAIFRVLVEDYNEELVFLKSKKTDRWWLELPVNTVSDKKLTRPQYIPCSYEDYKTALQKEIPDRWLKNQQKLM